NESIWTTSITLFEISWGLDFIASGRRRRELEAAFEHLITEDLNGRVQSFDALAGYAAGTIAAQRQRAGRGIEVRDLQIAGIVSARKGKLATRNTKHFDGVVIELVNPWA